MGHFSLDFKKAKGSSDARESDHIERKVIPDNADPTSQARDGETSKLHEAAAIRCGGSGATAQTDQE